MDKNKCNYIKNNIEYTLLRDIIKDSELYYDPKNNGNYDTDIEDDKEFLEMYKYFLDEKLNGKDMSEVSPWVIRFVFDKTKMLDKGIIMEDVYIAINTKYSNSIDFAFTDDNSKELIGRISIESDIGGEIDTNNGLEDQSDVVSTFKNIKTELLENVVIKGVKDITNVVMSEISTKTKIENVLQDTKEWILETDGTNLIDILALDYIDNTKTTSNDIIETYEIFGIEATRNILIEQLDEVFEEYINSRHIDLLVDMMTSRGYLISINSQGVNSEDIGPLAKCSFENTTKELINAGLFGKYDKLQGVSSNIMMGQKIHAGTNNCEILLDERRFMELLNDENTEPIYESQNKDVDTLFEQIIEEGEEEYDSACDDGDFEFSFE